jgi:hypothetical protein
MSTPIDQLQTQLTSDVPTLHNMLRNAISKIMAHSQTAQELLRVNTELKAALTLAQAEKSHLEAYINSVLNPPAQAVAATQTEEAPTATADAETTQPDAATQATETAIDANSVPA